jgi:hypothetical protein
VCTLRCVVMWGRWVNIFLHTSHEKGRSPVCTLIWFSRLGQPVQLLLHTLHAKGRAQPLNRCNALRLWVNDVTHITQVIVFLLLPLVRVCPDRLFLQENGFLHISHVWTFSSLHNSGNSALCSQRSSSALTSLFKCVAAVLVALKLTFWKKEKLYQDLEWSWTPMCFEVLQLSPWQILLHDKEARWRCVPSWPTKHTNLLIIFLSKY